MTILKRTVLTASTFPFFLLALPVHASETNSPKDAVPIIKAQSSKPVRVVHKTIDISAGYDLFTQITRIFL